VEHVPAAGSINASPTARKLASENNLDVTKIKGTGNFGRVMPEDVLRAAGKYVPPAVVAAPTAAAVAPTAIVSPPAAAKATSDKTTTVLDGVVAMDGMQKAVAKNMEKTMGVPVFRVSR
jgi:pyruvate/2-oxoglutarate dehydrogenase complex dihydrolipoamide acyltransferase (E2) component